MEKAEPRHWVADFSGIITKRCLTHGASARQVCAQTPAWDFWFYSKRKAEFRLNLRAKPVVVSALWGKKGVFQRCENIQKFSVWADFSISISFPTSHFLLWYRNSNANSMACCHRSHAATELPKKSWAIDPVVICCQDDYIYYSKWVVLIIQLDEHYCRRLIMLKATQLTCCIFPGSLSSWSVLSWQLKVIHEGAVLKKFCLK